MGGCPRWVARWSAGQSDRSSDPRAGHRSGICRGLHPAAAFRGLQLRRHEHHLLRSADGGAGSQGRQLPRQRHGERMTERMLPIPDGLEGERVDVALTRMLGLSRTKAAALIDAGLVLQDGRPLSKSDRLLVGSMLQVDPDALEPKSDMAINPEPVPGMRILYDDDDCVVVDKPVGVAAHPSPGWTGPTAAPSMRRSTAIRITTIDSRSLPEASRASRTTRLLRPLPMRPWSRCIWRPGAHTRSACTCRPCGTPASGI